MFGTDEKKHTEGPPSYSESEPKGSTSAVLSDTSHGVTLSVHTSSSGSYVPGSNLDARLSIPSDVLSGIVGDVEIRLEGKSSVEIMGKPRYQVCIPLKRMRRSSEIGNTWWNKPMVTSLGDQDGEASRYTGVPTCKS
jgi:hypothetical protein